MFTNKEIRMFNRIVASALVLFVVCGFVVAGMHTGVVTKFEDGKVTFKTKAKKGEEAKEFTFKVTDKTTFKTRKSKTETEDSDKSKFEEAVKNAKKGVLATIKTDDKDEVAEEITFGGGKKK
jgi:hypothetical protein